MAVMSIAYVTPRWRVLEEDDKFIVQFYNEAIDLKPRYDNCHVDAFDSLEEAILYIASMLVATAKAVAR
jgi:hypothetical protein